MTLLRVQDLLVRFGTADALDRVSLTVQEGERLAVVGQSGSGKSTLALALLGLTKWTGGSITGSIQLRHRELVGARESALREIRGKSIALVQQNAAAALNPAMKIEAHLREAWEAHSREPWKHQRDEALGLLNRFALPTSDEFLGRYPRQISIGQAQRVLIAMAMLHKPELLIADEPTSALDPSTSRDAIRALDLANRDWGTALLHITHDLATVPGLCSRAVVLHKGRVVEDAASADLFQRPQHEFTQQVVSDLAALHRSLTFSDAPVGDGAFTDVEDRVPTHR